MAIEADVIAFPHRFRQRRPSGFLHSMLQACGNIRKNRLGSDIEIIRNKTPVGRKHVIGFIVSEKTVRKQGGIAEGLNAQDYKCGQENDAGKESGAEEPVRDGGCI